MAKKTSWMPRLDIAFVFTTAFVIVLANLPAPIPHQVVEVESLTDSALPQQYSLAVNDPRLRKLSRHIERYGKTKPNQAVGKAKWMAETAAIYAERTQEDVAKVAAASKRTTPIMMVSYVPSGDVKPTKTDLVQYWSGFSQKSEQSIESIQHNWQARIDSLGPPPVALTRTVPGVVSGATLYVASILALFATVVMTVWRSSYPTRRLNHPVGLSAGDEEPQSHSDLAIVLPADSVRLHQPMMVHLRRLTYVAMLALAITSLV
ncbi:hypothetical protein Poly51_03240 [Rubripirellula tenax]|uniref:Uncharacterized protein n=1 Tax=Rubripirellula tenax TaxID=2528015 RepID=A0A5C6FGS8_9BACT|nr:hypothetical protein [Rubripirellula tenax]TWU60050.1 hypothetical protein Poly51_03240 [Rubripirellula tenax]